MTTTEVIEVQRVRGATLIKLVVVGSTIGCSLLCIVAGVFSFFGVEILTWNEEPVTGLSGLLSSPFIGAFIGLMFGLFTAFFAYVGLKVLSLFKPVVIEYVPVENGQVIQSDQVTDKTIG